MKSPRYILSKLRSALQALFRVDDLLRQQEAALQDKLDELKINQGLLLAEIHKGKASGDLRDYEFKVFSQWGEDGILQRLTEVVPIKHKTFIEFGVGDFVESNCRFLMTKENWRGYVIEQDSEAFSRMRSKDFYWKHDLRAINAFITKDNIDALLVQSGFDPDVGILSVDIDGNDYFVLEAICSLRARILICEYNAVFGLRKISVPYDASFNRTSKHHSNLYFGASLTAMSHLADQKGYDLVGVNRAGNNAFFVRRDLMNKNLRAYSAEELYSPSQFRESRSAAGNLTFLSAADRLTEIRGMPVTNIETGHVEAL